MLQPRTAPTEIAPYSQQLGDLFTVFTSVLVKQCGRKYRPRWGRAALPGKSRKSLPEFASGCTGAPAAAGGGVGFSAEGLRNVRCAGEGLWRLHLSTFTAAKTSNVSTGSSFRRLIGRRRRKNSCAPSTAPTS